MAIKVMSPQEMRAERVKSLEGECDALLEELMTKLRASPDLTAQARAKEPVVEAVAAQLRGAGWCCLVEKGGARDNGATWGLTVSAESIRCPVCSGRGSFIDERGVSDGNNRCSRCGGTGGVR